MKNKLIIAVIIIACLIPSLIAVVSYKTTKDAPVDMSTATTVTIDDKNGRSYTYRKGSEDKTESEQAEALINFFTKLNSHASSITGLPDSLLGEKFYRVSLSNAAREENYEYYFAADPNTCYYRSQNGGTYKIDPEDAKTFLATTYAESVYNDSVMPILTVAGTQTVTPDAAVWQYKNYSGDYVDANTSAYTKSEIETYDLAGGLDLAFDIKPDFCTVSVTADNGEKIWDGMLDELSAITLDKVRNVTVAVVAKWYEDSSRTFCGELDYAFGTVLTAPASFYLGMDEVQAGKFVAVTATNILKPDAIEMTSNMETTLAPVFYAAEDNMAVGLLPIDVDTPNGVYTLTFKYAGTTEDIAITVNANYVSASYCSFSEAVLSATRSEAALAQFDTTAKELMSKGSDERYFEGYFLEGAGSGASLTRGFGRDVYVNGSSTATYRNNGVDYAAVAGTDVVAANRGVIVYAGLLDYSGYTVVIEHGYGLKTWYYNLGETSVNVGDTVERGDKIGEAGQTGFTSGNGMHIAMSVGSTFVSPYDTWEDSEIAGKVIIPKIDEAEKD